MEFFTPTKEDLLGMLVVHDCVMNLFRDDSRWTQNTYASNADGDELNLYDPDATTYCIIGGAWHCDPPVINFLANQEDAEEYYHAFPGEGAIFNNPDTKNSTHLIMLWARLLYQEEVIAALRPDTTFSTQLIELVALHFNDVVAYDDVWSFLVKVRDIILEALSISLPEKELPSFFNQLTGKLAIKQE